LEKKGSLDNTLIIFTSDNGPWLSFGNHAGSSGGLREGKGTIWEGGVRVPCIAYWKGHIRNGTVNHGLASTLDLLPTIASICKAPLPEKKIDGVDLSILLSNSKVESPRKEFVYYYDRNNLKAIRMGQWKLVFPHTSQTYLNAGAIGNNGFPGMTANVPVPQALYDLEKDPAETKDLQAAHPDIVAKLTAVANQYRQMLGDDILGVKGNENRPSGKW
jgi:arylsulfatase